MLLENMVMAFIPLGVMALLIRFLLPKAIRANQTGTQIVLGTAVFVLYTLMQILLIRYMSSGAVSVEECMTRGCVAVVLMNLMMLFMAAQLFFIREKRPMTQEERMKLKDM